MLNQFMPTLLMFREQLIETVYPCQCRALLFRIGGEGLRKLGKLFKELYLSPLPEERVYVI
jgi:hypothetical protein